LLQQCTANVDVDADLLQQLLMQLVVDAGFLPFSAIYIELYYIFASVWGHKVYTIYSIVFIILIIVTAFITIALTYFQLAVEDHAWWWRSFLCGGSTGRGTTCVINPLTFSRHQALRWCLCLSCKLRSPVIVCIWSCLTDVA